MSAGTNWENLPAEDVLCLIFEKLRENQCYKDISHDLYDEVTEAYSSFGEKVPKASDEEFVSEFVADHPELFGRLKDKISEIFTTAGQFLPCRNPDLPDQPT
jgi:hypothetical protein